MNAWLFFCDFFLYFGRSVWEWAPKIQIMSTVRWALDCISLIVFWLMANEMTNEITTGQKIKVVDTQRWILDSFLRLSSDLWSIRLGLGKNQTVDTERWAIDPFFSRGARRLAGQNQKEHSSLHAEHSEISAWLSTRNWFAKMGRTESERALGFVCRTHTERCLTLMMQLVPVSFQGTLVRRLWLQAILATKECCELQVGSGLILLGSRPTIMVASHFGDKGMLRVVGRDVDCCLALSMLLCISQCLRIACITLFVHCDAFCFVEVISIMNG